MLPGRLRGDVRAGSVTWLRIDASGVPPQANAVLQALSGALALSAPAPGLDAVIAAWPRRRCVLVIDSIERLEPVAGWLRNALLPALPSQTSVILVGRLAPDTHWVAYPLWGGQMRCVALHPLARADASQLLAAHGLAEDARAGVLDLGHGHPLALALLAADVGRQGRVPSGLGNPHRLTTSCRHPWPRADATEPGLSPAGGPFKAAALGRYRVGGDELLTDGSASADIAVPDLTLAIVDEIDRPQNVATGGPAMSARDRKLPRRRQPELEHDYARVPSLGYESPADTGLVRCIAHGFPTQLSRWHFHDEHELHLITATSGKAFVGDWIGSFEPGHLVLCGPRLPHNWVSIDVPDGGVPERDLVIQFAHGPMAHAAEQIPEMAEVMALLERARHGIEFFGLADKALRHFFAVRSARGFQRLAAFCAYLGDLARCTDFRLLSSVRMQGEEDDAGNDRINDLVNRIMRDYAQPLSAAGLASELNMTESSFSRFFRRATGNTFPDFVNRIRVNHAAQLLMASDHLVSRICFEVGFNNLANFNRRFLEVKGVTPSEFRRQAEQRFGPAGS